MTSRERWLLPQGIDEMLPREAQQLEHLRRQIIDLFGVWGYQLVIPPLIEYLDSLLTGLGEDLDLQTFKITDRLTGRMMGVRADMTPQVARIDAHRLQQDCPSRLCYLGPVLHTLPDGFAASRNPLQLGAELYGHSGFESDVEIITLMLNTLSLAGINQVHLDLGHVGVFRSLVEHCGLNPQQTGELHELLQRKAAPELGQSLKRWSLPDDQCELWQSLVQMHGGEDMLVTAKERLAVTDQVSAAINELEQIAAQVATRNPGICINFDLAELRGYDYHTGVMFAAYISGHGQALACGGRYDDIGRYFGRGRPATGFSTDIKSLVSYCDNGVVAEAAGIAAEWSDDSEQLAAVQALRDQGEQVVMLLPGQTGDARTMGCNRRLLFIAGSWRVEALT